MTASASSSDTPLVRQLRQSLGMLQVAFDAAKEAMLIVDDRRCVHWANQASADLLVQGVPIQVVNRTIDTLFELEALDRRGLAARAVLDPQRTLPRERGEARCHVVLAHGERTSVQLLRWQPVELVQAPFVLLSFRDLSEEEQALMQQQRFMTDLTHELRTPLAIVNGNLRRISRMDGLPEAAITRLTMAKEEMKRIHRLLEHLSLLTRLEVDPDLLGCVDHQLIPLLERWQRSSRLLAPDLQLLIPEQPVLNPWVRTDPNALELVLDHLLENALQHGDPSMPIALRLLPSAEQHWCRLVLISGSTEPPVDPLTLQQWLKPFVRGAIRRDERHAEGAGLGLALARELVNGWGGELSLNQQPLEAGSEIHATISLPLSCDPASAVVQEADQTDQA